MSHQERINAVQVARKSAEVETKLTTALDLLHRLYQTGSKRRDPELRREIETFLAKHGYHEDYPQ